MSENPLVNLGDLSKPATVLVEKISDAVGGIFKPHQIVRIAKAEAEAERIRTQTQIEVTDLHRRALHRFLEEEAKKQSNIESITQQALPLLQDKSKPENMEDDWITNFFDKSRIVSDTDMQKLWAGVLAQEANIPGAFARRTVNLLGDLDRQDATLFARLCEYVWDVDDLVPLILDTKAQIYAKRGISFDALTHLESLGLIRFEALAGYKRVGYEKVFVSRYFDRELPLTFPNEFGNSLSTGNVAFTRAGLEIARICTSSPVEGFFDYVYGKWEEKSLVPKRAA